MRELIRIEHKDGEQVVSARELHNALEVQSRFNDWANRMLVDFEANIDFEIVLLDNKGSVLKNEYAAKLSSQQRSAKGIQTDYALLLDTAKHIAMIQRNDKGREIRRYFIEAEKQLRQQVIQKPMSNLELMKLAIHELEEQKRELAIHDYRIKELEAKATTRPEYYTVAGYARLIGVNVSRNKANSLGRKASKMCKDQTVDVGKVNDEKYGTVNSYPAHILQQVFDVAEA